MEESDPKKTRLSFSTLLLIVAFGVVVAAGLYQAKSKGILNIPSLKSTSPTIERIIINEENAVTGVVDKVSPSVVAIGISQQVINPFDPFSAPQKKDSTIGTGFVVSDKGIIVTNKHVVSQANAKYSVVTKDGAKYDLQKIYRDPLNDLAIVQISAPNLKSVELGDSSKIKVGQVAIAIGNALGQFTNTVTTGVVSGVGRKVVAGDPFSGAAESLDNLIQTDAAINPGNSGGPLLNSAGQVIGVNVATTEGAQNIGFAIPINSVKSIVDEFIQKGSVSRPYLGLRYKFISKDLAILNNIPQGAYVQEVLPLSPAQKAGVLVQDIITKINGIAVDSDTKISEVVAKSTIGARVELTIYRDKKEIKVTAVLEELLGE